MRSEGADAARAIAILAACIFLQQWNVIDSMKTYGSPEYSVIHPEEIGRDRLEISSVSLLADRRTLFVAAPAILPTMFTQIHGVLKDAEGKPVTVDLYATLNHLRVDSPLAKASAPGKPSDLKVVEKESNGDTYQQIVEHFDKLTRCLPWLPACRRRFSIGLNPARPSNASPFDAIFKAAIPPNLAECRGREMMRPMPSLRDITLVLCAAAITAGAVVLAQDASPQPSKMGSCVFDWTTIPVKKTPIGESRKFFRAPTATLDELECHVTTLNPGEMAHPPHQHPDEELLIIKEGTVEALVNGELKTVGPGSVIFQAANQLHSIKNVGETPATYHVIKWNSPGMLAKKL